MNPGRLLPVVASLALLAGLPVFAADGCAAPASEWQQLKNAGDSAYAVNNYGIAERNLTLALAAAEKFGPADLRLADTLHSLAALYSTRGQFNRAEPLYERELRVREKALGAEHPQVVAAVGRLTDFYLNHGSPQKAERLTSMLASFAERRINEQESLKSDLAKIDRYYDKSAGFAEARTILHKLKDETQRTTANENLELATTLDSLGHIYQGHGKYELAERLFKDALAFRERALSSGHMALAYSYENLANLYAAQGKNSQAEPWFKRALEVTEKTLQPEHPEVYSRLDELAQNCLNMGQVAQAESLYKRALQVMEKNASRADVGRASLALGMLYARQGRYSAAEPLMKRALAAAENANGPQHASLAPILDSYAEVLDKLNRGAEAARMRSRARTIRGVAVVNKASGESDDF